MRKYLSIALAIVILDLISKQWIFNHLDLGSALVLNSFLNIVHFQNTGAAFSFLSDASGWQRYFFIGRFIDRNFYHYSINASAIKTAIIMLSARLHTWWSYR